MSTSYGEPTPGTQAPDAPAPVAATVQPAAPAAPVTDPTPAPGAAQEPAAPSVPAVAVPPVGTLTRYSSYDAYAQPARDRDQLVLVTGHVPQADGTTQVAGIVLGWADEVAHFLAEKLTRA